MSDGNSFTGNKIVHCIMKLRLVLSLYFKIYRIYAMVVHELIIKTIIGWFVLIDDRLQNQNNSQHYYTLYGSWLQESKW